MCYLYSFLEFFPILGVLIHVLVFEQQTHYGFLCIFAHIDLRKIDECVGDPVTHVADEENILMFTFLATLGFFQNEFNHY